MKITELIKDNVVQFHSLRAGVAYYKIKHEELEYKFPVPLDDIGESTLLSTDKAIFFMRWIRKAISSNELVLCN